MSFSRPSFLLDIIQHTHSMLSLWAATPACQAPIGPSFSRENHSSTLSELGNSQTSPSMSSPKSWNSRLRDSLRESPQYSDGGINFTERCPFSQSISQSEICSSEQFRKPATKYLLIMASAKTLAGIVMIAGGD